MKREDKKTREKKRKKREEKRRKEKTREERERGRRRSESYGPRTRCTAFFTAVISSIKPALTHK